MTGTVVLTTGGSTFDTLLSVYTGAAYPLTYIASNNDDPDPVLKDQYGGFTSSLTFSATAGTTYHIAVDGTGGAAGRVVLAGGYQYSINAPPDIATYPKTASKLNLAAHYTGTQSGNPHAYLVTSSQQGLGDLDGGGSYGYGLNALDTVVGESDLSGVNHAFIWDPLNGMRWLDSSGYPTVALAINDAGTAVGFATIYNCNSGFTYDSAAYWQNGTVTVLPDLGGGRCYAQDINILNEIAGRSYLGPDCNWTVLHPVYWRLKQDGVETVDLGHLGGGFGTSESINSGGQIAGESTTVGQRRFPRFSPTARW